MDIISTGDFSTKIQEYRTTKLGEPFDLAYESFVKLGYDTKDEAFFINNASEIILALRETCWSSFLQKEAVFTSEMLESLIDKNHVSKMDPVEAIREFLQIYPEHIYLLSLSNTQSRRSRAGKEFEAIIFLLLTGAGIQSNSQGSIGKNYFQKNNLGKLVDFVIPGVFEYNADKHNSILVSAKTTLRERWQEVPEELQRTGSSMMYLATLDDSISDEAIRIMNEANIILVTLKELKDEIYADKRSVIDFETFLQRCVTLQESRKAEKYSPEEISIIAENLSKQIDKYRSYDFVKQKYSVFYNVRVPQNGLFDQ